MKKLLYAIRMWLLSLLHGEPEECTEKTEDAYMDYICEQSKQISMLVEAIALYKKAVREICRRSENTYYDWCCDQCACDCDKRNGWCNSFEPVRYEK